MPEFSVQFDVSPFEELDQLALLACQDYNLGGAGDWFGEFRGGLYGFYARMYGVQCHYFEVHAWLPRVRIPTETEYHLSSILFQMDSALECLTFALNALGWIVMPAGFRDVTDAKALKRISPLDILGDATKTPPITPLAGFAGEGSPQGKTVPQMKTGRLGSTPNQSLQQTAAAMLVPPGSLALGAAAAADL